MIHCVTYTAFVVSCLYNKSGCGESEAPISCLYFDFSHSVFFLWLVNPLAAWVPLKMFSCMYLLYQIFAFLASHLNDFFSLSREA